MDGTKLLFVDGVTVAQDGLIYFTDVSTKYPFETFMRDTLEGRPNGRIVVYNPATQSSRVVVDGLYFPNGIALSRDGSFLLITETLKARISKFYLKGDQEGDTETVNDSLPGFPDNIHWNAKGDVLYVGIVGGPRDVFLDLLWKSPFAKSLLALYPSLQKPFDMAKTGSVLAIDESGKPVKYYQDPSGKTVGYLTTGVEVDGFLYVGGLRDDFVGRIKV